MKLDQWQVIYHLISRIFQAESGVATNNPPRIGSSALIAYYVGETSSKQGLKVSVEIKPTSLLIVFSGKAFTVIITGYLYL